MSCCRLRDKQATAVYTACVSDARSSNLQLVAIDTSVTCRMLVILLAATSRSGSVRAWLCQNRCMCLLTSCMLAGARWNSSRLRRLCTVLDYFASQLVSYILFLQQKTCFNLHMKDWGMDKTARSQNGDKPKRLQVQRKRINLLSSTVDSFSVLLTKFGLIQEFLPCSH